MQAIRVALLASVVLYREGDEQHPALVTKVGDEGHVNLAVFAADGHCYGRSNVAPGEGPDQWQPVGELVGGEVLTSEHFHGLAEVKGLIEREMKTLDELTDSVRAMIAKQQEKIDALEKQVAELTAKAAAVNAPSSTPTPAAQ